jgi:hypothetical protein
MTQNEIIEMAKQAGFVEMPETPYGGSKLEAFAKLVAQLEREACAKVCESHWEKEGSASWCARAIRARGQA